MNWQPWLSPPVLTSLLLGGYGAVLATATFIQNVRRDRRGWKLITRTAIPMEPEFPNFLNVTFINEGHRPITVDQMTLELPNRKWMANADARMPNARLPVTLSDSQSTTVYFGYDHIASALQRTGATRLKVVPIAKDAAGRIYRGKAVSIA